MTSDKEVLPACEERTSGSSSQPGSAHLPSAARIDFFQLGLNFALLGAWIWLYRPVFEYLSVIFSREEFRTNQIVLAIVTGLVIYQLRKSRPRLRFDAAPRLFLPGLGIMLVGSVAYLLVERFLDINTLSASLFVFSTYGLLGLWLAPQRWKKGVPAMLLVTGVLPFGVHLETFAGYPLRVLTARLVGSWLAGMGFPSLSSNTILVFESGISQVDIPCSGVKSLWTGALFLLAATWIENRAVNLRWLLVAFTTGALLISANFLRVAILALTGPALGWTEFARMLHLPLGVLGFLASCTAAVFLLRRLGKESSGQTLPAPVFAVLPAATSPKWLGVLLGVCTLALALAYVPRTASLDRPTSPAWSLPAELHAQPAPLSEKELAWIRDGGAFSADRYTFHWQGASGNPEEQISINGTFMFLTSGTWRAQHQPERCFQVYGLEIAGSYTLLVRPDFPLRYLALSAPGSPNQVSAVYWLQSPSQTTEDFGQRIWQDLSPQREPWVLVTVLFDRDYAMQLTELHPLLEALHASVNSSLQERNEP